MKKCNEIFKNNLNYMLALKKIRQIDLSRDLKIPKATVSSWCTGKRTPKWDKIFGIGEYLGLSDPTILLKENISEYTK